MAKAFIIVGGTGAGKTTFVKKSLDKVDKRSIMLYDINAEYKDYFEKPLLNIEDFAEKASHIENAVIVFEEATIFFSNRSSNDYVREILVRKRHTKNVIFLVFHSLRTIPRYIYDLCNYVVLFKTNDSRTLIDNKFTDDRLTQVFERVKKSKNPHYCEIFSIY
jgi:adenylate kinase family enzyme